MGRFLSNSQCEPDAAHHARGSSPRSFHRRLPGYAATPLRDLSALARELGIAELWIKDESRRFDLPAFKILGASWAAYRALAERADQELEPWRDLGELREKLARLRPCALVTATDGNHGRAVARVAKLLGLGAHVFLPADAVPARARAIESEGAELTLVHGTYDTAVERAAEHARREGERAVLLQDTSWPGYEEIPLWVIDGYATLFEEIDEELEARGAAACDVVLIQIGVGALAAAAARHFRRGDGARDTKLVGVEPVRAACAFESIAAGELVEIPGPHDSIMAGLNCGRVATVAWPLLRKGFDAFVTVDDERCEDAVRALADASVVPGELASPCVVSGESGAAGLAGLFEILCGADHRIARDRLGIGAHSRVLAVSTEGATDPAAWQRITGRSIVRPDVVEHLDPSA